MPVSLVVLRCRTSDRTPGAGLGAATLAPLVAERLGVTPRQIGGPGDPHEGRWDDDLRDSRGCLLEAGGQVDDALSGGNVPLLLAGDCSVCLTTLPAALRHRPEARVLWLDAHGDYNTPDTTGSGFLGGMCLAGACGEWAPGLGERIPPERVVLAGVRDLDRGERELLERSPVTVIGASVIETLVAVKNALDSAPVYVHLDLDVLDPEVFPAQFPAPGGLRSGQAVRPARLGERGLRAGGPGGDGVRGTRVRARAAGRDTDGYARPGAGSRGAPGSVTKASRLAPSTSAPATTIAARMPDTKSPGSLNGPAATAVAIDPSAARPSAEPTWRAVFRTPDATPARCTSIAPIAIAEMAGTAAPYPIPTST